MWIVIGILHTTMRYYIPIDDAIHNNIGFIFAVLALWLTPQLWDKILTLKK